MYRYLKDITQLDLQNQPTTTSTTNNQQISDLNRKTTTKDLADLK